MTTAHGDNPRKHGTAWQRLSRLAIAWGAMGKPLGACPCRRSMHDHNSSPLNNHGQRRAVARGTLGRGLVLALGLLVASPTIIAGIGCKRIAVPPPPPTNASRIHFIDQTATAGLEMTTVSGTTPSSQILEVNGTGLALFDYDNDGDLDIFLANGATLDDTENGPGCRLFENRITPSGFLRFVDVTESAGIAVTRWTMGVAAADINGDGFDDLYLTCFGPNVLLTNNGDGTFTDATDAAGVGDDRWGTTAAFGDFDHDNDLDLYVVNYLHFDPANPPRRDSFQDVDVMGGPHGLTPQADLLYRNNGDGTFTDITASSGCADAPPSFGLNAVTVDADDDGRQDIIVGNDSMPNFYFRNVTERGGDIRFEELGLRSGLSGNGDGMPQATMGMAISDVNDDGRPDLFSSNFSGDTNTLHVNVQGRMFDDHTTRYGFGMTTRPYLGWGSAFADFDHDGDEDLLVVNGHVYPEATRESMGSDYEQPPLLYERIEDRFHALTPRTAGDWLGQPSRDRALAVGDLDRDGDLDAVITELNGPVRILANDSNDVHANPTERGHWLIVELNDPRPESQNRRGIGSKVELHAGDHIYTRWLIGGGAFQSSHAPMLHFGIATHTLDAHHSSPPLKLIITWPDGTTQTVTDFAADTSLMVERE